MDEQPPSFYEFYCQWPFILGCLSKGRISRRLNNQVRHPLPPALPLSAFFKIVYPLQHFLLISTTPIYKHCHKPPPYNELEKRNVTVQNNFYTKLISARNTKLSFGTQSLYNYLWLEQLGEMYC